MSFKGRSLCSIDDLSRDEVRYMMRQAVAVKKALEAGDSSIYRLIDNSDFMIASAFVEDSTRTRISFEEAIERLGARIKGFGSSEGTSMAKKGESLRHTIEMLRVYHTKAIVMRHVLDGSARFIANLMAGYGVPVINGGDGRHEHPTQTLLDRFSVLEAFDRLRDDCEHPFSLRGLTITLSGDLFYGRVPHSLVKDFSQDGVHFMLVAPEEFQMPEAYLRIIEKNGSTWEQAEKIDGSVMSRTDAMFVFRFQTERIADTTKLSLARRNCHLRYEHLALAKPTMRIFHPLPINSQFPEIDPLIDDTEFQYFFNQAGNGVPIRIVVLACFLGVMGEDFQGESPASRVLNDYFIHRREPRARAETDEELNLKPIRDWGVVIDHFPAARLKLLVDYLVRDGEVYRGGVVRKHSDPTKTKGLLMIEHRTLTDAERRIVAAMGQGELTAGELPTVNDIVDGSVAEKVDLTIPDLIEGIGQCTNIIFDRETGKPKGGCISRPEFHQHATPRFYRVDDQQVQCAYCDTVMESYRIFE